MQQQKLARGLGWCSIGLGLTELLGARRLGRFAGVPHRTGVIRLRGVREIAHGVALLSAGRKGPWSWARVAGDAIDLSLLGAAYGRRRARRDRLTQAALGVAGVTTAAGAAHPEPSRAP